MVKLKDSEYKNSSLVSQIDRKNTKEKSKLLLKKSFNSFTKIPPISPVRQTDQENLKNMDKLLSN